MASYDEGKAVVGLWSVLLELMGLKPKLTARDEVQVLEFVSRQLNSITHQAELVGTVARQLRSREEHGPARRVGEELGQSQSKPSRNPTARVAGSAESSWEDVTRAG